MALSSTHRDKRAMPVGLLVVGLALAFAACSDNETDSEGGAPASGAALYEASCASCHGSDLRGTDQGPSHLSRVYAPDHHPDASFRVAITQGAPAHHWDFGDMPSVEGLDDDEIELIIAYVRDQQQAQGLEPFPPG